MDFLINIHLNQAAGSIIMTAMRSVGYFFNFQKGECIRKKFDAPIQLASMRKECHERGITWTAYASPEVD